MKKLYISAIFLLVILNGNAQQKEYSGQMHITPIALRQQGDSLYMKLNFDLSGVNVDSRHSISLIPSLVAPTTQLDLPEVMVKGQGNYHIYEREMALMSKHECEQYNLHAPYAVLKGFKNKGPRSIVYEKTIKYEPWMADARLDIYEDLCGCGNAPRRMGISMLASQVELEKASSVIDDIKSAIEPQKRYETMCQVFLDFEVGSSLIRPDYMHNPRELEKITNLINQFKKDKDLVVRSILITGYASPEGSVANNKRLSEKRAKALSDYLYAHFDYPHEMYNTTYAGENWEGLKQCVENSQLPFRQQVLDILETVPAEINYTTNTSLKKALMNLNGGNPYRYMYREFFPSLRKAVCIIVFEVKTPDISEDYNG